MAWAACSRCSTDWFLAASLSRNGPRLAGERGGWPQAGRSVKNGALQPKVGRVERPLMKRNLSSAEGGRLDITPKWVDIQTCIITC